MMEYTVTERRNAARSTYARTKAQEVTSEWFRRPPRYRTETELRGAIAMEIEDAMLAVEAELKPVEQSTVQRVIAAINGD